MLTVENSWALMEGAQPSKEDATAMKTVKALRGFWHEGRLVKPGEYATLPIMLVAELVNSQKAIVEEEPNDGTASEVSSGESAEDVQGVD
jgi:hypothetical protein